MIERLKVERGSANVFRDLGFPDAEAGVLLLRSQLMSEVDKIAQGRTNAQAAMRLGVSQARMNDLMRGDIDKFSLEDLVIMLSKAGMHVEMRVR